MQEEEYDSIAIATTNIRFVFDALWWPNMLMLLFKARKRNKKRIVLVKKTWRTANY